MPGRICKSIFAACRWDGFRKPKSVTFFRNQESGRVTTRTIFPGNGVSALSEVAGEKKSHTRHFQLSFRKVSVSGTDCKFWQSKMAERCNEFGLTIHRGQAQESVAKEQLRKAARGRRSLKLTGSGTVWAYLLFFNSINSAGGTRSSAKPQSRQTKSCWQKYTGGAFIP